MWPGLNAGDHAWVYHYGVNSCETDDEVSLDRCCPCLSPQILESVAGATADLCLSDSLFLHAYGRCWCAPPLFFTWSGRRCVEPAVRRGLGRCLPPTRSTGALVALPVEVLDGNFCAGTSANYTVEVRPLPVGAVRRSPRSSATTTMRLGQTPVLMLCFLSGSLATVTLMLGTNLFTSIPTPAW